LSGIKKSRHSRRRLPPRRSQDPDAHVFHRLVQFFREDAVSVVDQELIRMVVWQCLPELLQRPLRGWMSGYVVMENSSRSHVHDHEHAEGAEGGRDHGEEVARDNHRGMVADEGQPSLLRIWRSPGPSPSQAFLRPRAHSRRRSLGSIAAGPWASRVFPSGWTSNAGRTGIPAMATDQGVRLHIHQRTASREQSAQRCQYPPGGVVGPWWSDLALLKQR
jgi:hypothetical protein